MATAYLGVGANLGEKKKNTAIAIKRLAQRAGRILALSPFYESPAWGFVSENDFLNVALAIETPLSPFRLLAITQQIEREMGRTVKTSGVYQDRIIDIDILLYEDRILNTPRLTLPHPLMHERRFVIVPLARIAPGLLHPVLGKTIGELAEAF
ncbi:MAG: 2-amino-4-hydroxy-6-hydroxymethyldihydropteridine diphosphokinase [Tannerellaceae bacterium]|jgi:2-amino-4-hydroxy-6-hydroxymethyldihydropteridine diphosphokinase|nr:2-amino-4-hydroxy-6-hydroxymethyldihydropteridine diphosphokinase [Tannerellaceae bacterium]